MRGENVEKYGPRFPDMTEIYSRQLIKVSEAAAEKTGINIKRGVYMFFGGPQYETPAEIRAARILGADAVGMSTVPEAIIARHMKMETLAISTITNMAAGVLDQPLSHDEVMETGVKVGAKFSSLIKEILFNI